MISRPRSASRAPPWRGRQRGGNPASGHMALLADLTVKAVSLVVETHDGKRTVDEDNIQVTKKHGGSVSDTSLLEGVIVDKERGHPGMPDQVKDAKVARG